MHKLLAVLAVFICLAGFASADELPAEGLSRIIPAGTPNKIAGEHFTGKSWLYPLSTQ